MKKLVLVSILSTLLSTSGISGVYILEGIYQGKDIYVQNPFANEGVGFCIYEVLVNGQVASDEINSSAFAVDLSQYEFTTGDELIITIRSKADCNPRVINPEAISPTSSCVISDLELKENGKLVWMSENENGKLPFIIEHFKWNKWVQIGSVLGDGKREKTEYSVDINLPGGENKIRIKQKDYNGERVTEEVSLTVSKKNVELISKKVSSKIEFTDQTHYELFDSFGELVFTGFDSEVDVSKLERGTYYLNYELDLGVEVRKK